MEHIYSFITVLNCLNIAYTKFGALPENILLNKAEAQKNPIRILYFLRKLSLPM